MLKSVGGLDKDLLGEIVRAITSHREVEKIVLYGSRATGQFRPESDIDLAVFGGLWTSDDLSAVKFYIEDNIKTPLKFDIVLYDTIGKKSLREDIQKEGIVIYESKKD